MQIKTCLGELKWNMSHRLIFQTLYNADMTENVKKIAGIQKIGFKNKEEASTRDCKGSILFNAAPRRLAAVIFPQLSHIGGTAGPLPKMYHSSASLHPGRGQDLGGTGPSDFQTSQ